MITDLFTMENGVVSLSLHCYIIPEFKNIVDKYPDNYMNMLAYAFYVGCPFKSINPYADFSEEDKEEKLKESFHIFPDNKDVLIAVELIKDLYPTKGMKYVQSIRSSIDKTMEYLDNAVIREGKDGNLADIRGMQKDAAKVLESLTLMEKNAEEEKNNFRTKAGRKTGLGEIL